MVHQIVVTNEEEATSISTTDTGLIDTDTATNVQLLHSNTSINDSTIQQQQRCYTKNTTRPRCIATIVICWLLIVTFSTVVSNQTIVSDISKSLSTLNKFNESEPLPQTTQTSVFGDVAPLATSSKESSTVTASDTPRSFTQPTNVTYQNRTITILIQYSGELGNHLSKLAAAYMTQYITKKKYPYISYQFIGQHQSHKKWMNAARELSLCFPNLHLNNMLVFDGGIHDPNFLPIQEQQESWLNETEQIALRNVHDDTSLDVLHHILQREDNGVAPIVTPAATSMNGTDTGKYQYSLPYLIADEMIWTEVLYHPELYHEIRTLFTYDETVCCNREMIQDLLHPQNPTGSSGTIDNDTDTNTNNTPSATTTTTTIVYHHRNFVSEISSQTYSMRGTAFMEVTPYTASRYMFAEYSSATGAGSGNATVSGNNTFRPRIAMLSRKSKGLDAYQKEFTEYNHIPSYIVSNFVGDTTNSGIYDFCFIMKSPYIAIGKLISTFVGWATILGNTPIVRLYMMENYNETESNSFEIVEEIFIDQRRFIIEVHRQPT